MRLRTWPRLLVAVFVPVTACGPSSGKPGGPTSTSVSGSAGGQPFEANDTVGVYSAGSASPPPYAGVFVSNFTGTCALLQSGDTAPASTTLLSIQLYTVGGSTAAPAPGTYTLGVNAGTVQLVVQYAASDSSCNRTTDEEPSGGSVTLDTVGSTLISGAFDLTFASGDHLSGSFYGPVCNVDLTALGTQGSGCVQRDH